MDVILFDSVGYSSILSPSLHQTPHPAPSLVMLKSIHGHEHHPRSPPHAHPITAFSFYLSTFRLSAFHLPTFPRTPSIPLLPDGKCLILTKPRRWRLLFVSNLSGAQTEMWVFKLTRRTISRIGSVVAGLLCLSFLSSPDRRRRTAKKREEKERARHLRAVGLAALSCSSFLCRRV